MIRLISMPTMQGREIFAKKAIESLLVQKFDKMIIHLNGKVDISLFPKSKKIIYKKYKKNMGPIIRYKIRNLKFDYLFTVDDDIIYPENYISQTISNFFKYKQNVISYHAHHWSCNSKLSYSDKITVRYDQETASEAQKTVLGSGVSMFPKETFKFASHLDSDDFWLNDDLWASYIVHLSGKRIIRPPTPKNWIKKQVPHPHDTLYDLSLSENFSERNMLINKLYFKYNYNFSLKQ